MSSSINKHESSTYMSMMYNNINMFISDGPSPQIKYIIIIISLLHVHLHQN